MVAANTIKPRKRTPDARSQAEELMAAAESGDADRVQQSLQAWLKARWPHLAAASLDEIRSELELEELEKLHMLLNAALYAQPPRPLNRQQVEILVRRLIKRERSAISPASDTSLPELFG